jgi:hypothetical protein
MLVLLIIQALSVVLCVSMSIARQLRWVWAVIAVVAWADVSMVAAAGWAMPGLGHRVAVGTLLAWYLTLAAVAVGARGLFGALVLCLGFPGALLLILSGVS